MAIAAHATGAAPVADGPSLPFGTRPRAAPLASFRTVTTAARILLVRHGESTWNAAARWQGRADPPLTATGQRQAAEAAEAVGMVDAIVASPLQRAHHTAVILGELIGIGPVVLEDRLVERDAGEWTGLTMAEIDERYPGDRQAFRTPPGFESDEDLVARVVPALQELGAAFDGGSILAVTHGGVILGLTRHLAGDGSRIPNLGAQWVEVLTDGGLVLGPRVPLLAEHTGGPGTSDLTEQV